MSGFSFSFAGDDIEDDQTQSSETQKANTQAAETGTLCRPAPSTAFPVTGATLLPPTHHSLASILSLLPSKVSYSSLVITLDDGGKIAIPRRELWDVRVQLMAEEDDEGLRNLGSDDVRTGVYEGGFKSWESSVDLVKVLHSRRGGIGRRRILEMGCGTALPSMAMLQWMLEGTGEGGLDLGLADYNPTVLQLVTLPNLLLSWAQVVKGREGEWEEESDLEITEELLVEFTNSLAEKNIKLSFFSGVWSPEFVQLVEANMGMGEAQFTVIGAETIYSPAALKSFADSLVGLLQRMLATNESSLVAAKKVYFGVGGSMEDFCDIVRAKGFSVEGVREESDGVRRAVVEVKISNTFES
ncbi:hypothetical protein BJ878DRAFT_167043 [Calycina marina]|uniref:protein-histidine N-methyltransferase n=1 Tax=Calycina marina TaxID=1763456 RepID=A0A9P8CEP3_9HELO|nr:hypothetical protein BJ878DRAFT_167043 [Calycina marina]